jgi:asparagine synthase (glutamine-hydrolysing)
MSLFYGALIWDTATCTKTLRDLIINLTPDNSIRLVSGQVSSFIRWENKKPDAFFQFSQSGPVSVAVIGSACMRPELPGEANIADFVSRSLSDHRPIKSILQDLDGAFILLAWDFSTETVYLAVDPMGRRVLYYSTDQGCAVWASHAIKAARLTGTPQIDREALNLYFALKGIPAPWSIFAGVRKVKPGNFLILTRQAIQEHEYWSLAEKASKPYEGSFTDAQEELIYHLKAAIQRYTANVSSPLGVFLSGGLDSTTITALAQQNGLPVQAYSVGYSPTTSGDESRYARQAANEMGVPIESHVCSARDMASLVQEIIPALPEPIADATLFPELFLARQTRNLTMTILDGTGADGVLGGSNKYVAAHYSHLYLRIPPVLRRKVVLPLSSLLPASRRWQLTNSIRKWQFFIAGCELPAEEREAFWTSFIQRNTIQKLLSPSWQFPTDLGRSLLLEHLTQVKGSVSSISYMTLKCIMPWVELIKLGAIEQITGLSIQTPFLSPEIVEFGLRLPDTYKIQGKQGKFVLREASKELVPPLVLQRPKANFAPPINTWLQEDFHGLFWDTISTPTGLFDIDYIRGMARQNNLDWRDWRSELWAIYILQSWWITNQL